MKTTKPTMKELEAAWERLHILKEARKVSSNKYYERPDVKQRHRDRYLKNKTELAKLRKFYKKHHDKII